MSARSPRPSKERFGLRAFNQAIASLRNAGAFVPAARFEEALRQRRRLMKALRKADPENPILTELDLLDGRSQPPAAPGVRAD